MSLLNYVPNFLNQVLLFVQLNLTKIISNVLGDIWKFPLKGDLHFFFSSNYAVCDLATIIILNFFYVLY